MIKRYSRPRVKQVWSEGNKFDQCLKVEIAVCEALAEPGECHHSPPKIRKTSYDLDRIAEFLKATHHDMTAFLNSVAESAGGKAMFFDLELSSSDVVDTGWAFKCWG